ncbi:MAG: hypothetical protein U0271_20340 [Polyangiaceae bacterium]
MTRMAWLKGLVRAGVVAATMAVALSATGCTEILANAAHDNYIVDETRKPWPEAPEFVFQAARTAMLEQGYTIESMDELNFTLRTVTRASGVNSNPGSYSYVTVTVRPAGNGADVEVVEHNHLVSDQGKVVDLDQRLGMVEFAILRRVNPQRAADIEQTADAKADEVRAERAKKKTE